MKADLAKREPEMLAAWERDDVYGKIRKVAKGRPTFILTARPPSANGALHLGHSLNKILKDIIVKSRTLDGYDAPYVPGWDCHGLPIEMQVEKTHGRVGQKIDAKAFRTACREYAYKQVDAQRKDFKRLGVLGDWEHPYLTMDPRFEAEQLRAFAVIIKNGHVYKGYKPVHWCLNCRSALAEVKGEVLEHLKLQHPFYERMVPVILGDHVTLDAGTGAVHTAPGHGLDDYIAGLRYNLEIDNPVGGDGRF